MKKYKMLRRGGRIYILHWESDGKLFGPGWDAIAGFEGNDSNERRCMSIVRLMNECDNYTDND